MPRRDLAQPVDARACTERAHAEGHWIGNHTWTHSRPLGREARPQRRPIWRSAARRPRSAFCRTQNRLFPTPRWRRPPGPPAAECPDAAALLKAGGYTCVLWNAIPRDWDGAGGLGRDRACAARAAILDADGAARCEK